jgi:hypothetical protein
MFAGPSGEVMLRSPALFKLQEILLADFGVVLRWLEHEVVSRIQRGQGSAADSGLGLPTKRRASCLDPARR